MGIFDKIKNTVNEVNDIKNRINDSVFVLTYTPDVVCSDSSKIRKDLIYTRYNLDDIKRTKSNDYLLKGSNISLASNEIMYINKFLADATHKIKFFPMKRIEASDLCFNERLLDGMNAFCFVSFNPLTGTGKMPQYPMVLHFYASKELFGDLFYSQGGFIGKGNLVVWDGANCYEVHLRIIDDELTIHTIYQMNSVINKRVRVYYQ